MVIAEDVVTGSDWTGESDLPRWDLTVLYPGLESPEFIQGMADLVTALADLEAQTPFLDAKAAPSGSVSAAEVARTLASLEQRGAPHAVAEMSPAALDAPQQFGLFAPQPSPALEALDAIDPDELTPKQALEALYRLRQLR